MGNWKERIEQENLARQNVLNLAKTEERERQEKIDADNSRKAQEQGKKREADQKTADRLIRRLKDLGALKQLEDINHEVWQDKGKITESSGYCSRYPNSPVVIGYVSLVFEKTKLGLFTSGGDMYEEVWDGQAGTSHRHKIHEPLKVAFTKLVSSELCIGLAAFEDGDSAYVWDSERYSYGLDEKRALNAAGMSYNPNYLSISGITSHSNPVLGFSVEDENKTVKYIEDMLLQSSVGRVNSHRLPNDL